MAEQSLKSVKTDSNANKVHKKDSNNHKERNTDGSGRNSSSGSSSKGHKDGDQNGSNDLSKHRRHGSSGLIRKLWVVGQCPTNSKSSLVFSTFVFLRSIIERFPFVNRP